jgi:hypothetical protein
LLCINFDCFLKYCIKILFILIAEFVSHLLYFAPSSSIPVLWCTSQTLLLLYQNVREKQGRDYLF